MPTRDGGCFGTTQAGDGAYPVSLDQMQEIFWQLGGDDNRQFAYNHIAWFTVGVLYDDGMSEDSLAVTHNDGPHLNSSMLTMCGPALGRVLFHEAGHVMLDERVPCPERFEIQDCPDCVDTRPPAYDADEEGTYALSASLLLVYLGTCEDPEEDVYVYIEKMRAVECSWWGWAGEWQRRAPVVIAVGLVSPVRSKVSTRSGQLQRDLAIPGIPDTKQVSGRSSPTLNSARTRHTRHATRHGGTLPAGGFPVTDGPGD